MTYRLEIRPDALSDIEEAARWYDEREPGLGSDFANEVLQAIDILPNNPRAYRIRHKRKNVRWKLLGEHKNALPFFERQISSGGCDAVARRGNDGNTVG